LFAGMAVAKNLFGEYPAPQAQFLSARHSKGCVSFLYTMIEGVNQSEVIALLYTIKVTSMGMSFVGENLIREALGYVSAVVRDAEVTDHFLSEIELLST